MTTVKDHTSATDWDDLLIPPQARGNRITFNLNDELAAYVPRRPGAYLRITSDRLGLEAGVDRQHEDAEDRDVTCGCPSDPTPVGTCGRPSWRASRNTTPPRDRAVRRSR